MSDYHVMAGDDAGNAFTVAFHVPVPDQDNYVGYSYRQAVVDILGGASNIKSSCPFINPAELTQMQAGEVFEITALFYSYPGENLAAKQARLDTMHGEIVTATQQLYINKLGYWGYSRTIP